MTSTAATWSSGRPDPAVPDRPDGRTPQMGTGDVRFRIAIADPHVLPLRAREGEEEHRSSRRPGRTPPRPATARPVAGQAIVRTFDRSEGDVPACGSSSVRTARNTRPPCNFTSREANVVQ